MTESKRTAIAVLGTVGAALVAGGLAWELFNSAPAGVVTAGLFLFIIACIVNELDGR